MFNMAENEVTEGYATFQTLKLKARTDHTARRYHIFNVLPHVLLSQFNMDGP